MQTDMSRILTATIHPSLNGNTYMPIKKVYKAYLRETKTTKEVRKYLLILSPF